MARKVKSVLTELPNENLKRNSRADGLIWNDELNALPLRWTFEELERQNNAKRIDFNIAFQRGQVWSVKNNSDYIQSILSGMTTGTFLLNKVDNLYEGLDGKQRNFAVSEYLKDSYKLHKNTDPVIFEGKKYTIGECRFSELPEELQIRIKSRTIDIYYFENLSTDNKVKVFSRVNSGKPVTTADIARIKVKSRDVFLKLVEHSAIANGVRANDIKKCVDEDIVKWIWCVCYNESPSLLQIYTSKILEEVEVTDEQYERLKRILDYIDFLFKKANSKEHKKVYNKIRTRTHFVMIGYMANVAIESNIEVDIFTKKALSFFNGVDRAASINSRYNGAMKGGTAKPEQVSVRMNEVRQFLLQ